jgi:hypothetical protein
MSTAYLGIGCCISPGNGGRGGGVGCGGLCCACCVPAMTGGSRVNISASTDRNSSTFDLCITLSNIANFALVVASTHLPIVSPMRQVRMVDSSITADMLARSYDHVIRRCYIAHRCFVRVGMGNPNRDWKPISCPAKCHRHRASDDHEESGCSMLGCYRPLLVPT